MCGNRWDFFFISNFGNSFLHLLFAIIHVIRTCIRYLVTLYWIPYVSVTPGCVGIYTTIPATCDEPLFSTPPDRVSKLLTDSDKDTCVQTFVDQRTTYFRAKVINTFTGMFQSKITVYVTGYDLRCSPAIGVNIMILPSCELADTCDVPIICRSKSELFLPGGMVQCIAWCEAREVKWNFALVSMQRKPGSDIDYDTWRVCEVTFEFW